MSDLENENENLTVDVGMDLGKLIHEGSERRKFEDWREIRVFEVYRCGLYIAFKRGDSVAVSAICHEIIGKTDAGNDKPRFKALSLDHSPVEGWAGKMAWKYQGNACTVNVLAEKLRQQPEVEGWKIKEEEGAWPMDRVATRKQIAKLCHMLQTELRPMPTDKMCFTPGSGNTVTESIAWYKRCVLGEVAKKRKVADRGF